MALAGGWLLRNAVCSLGVLVLVGGAMYGLPAVDRELPDHRPVPTDRPYGVAGAITVVPPPGALLDLTRTRWSSERGSAVFLAGGLRYGVVVAPATVQPSGAERRLSTKLRTAGFQILEAGTEVSTVDGRTGLAGRFGRSGRTGRYAVFVVAGHEVQVTVVGSADELCRAGRVVDQMIASIRGPA